MLGLVKCFIKVSDVCVGIRQKISPHTRCNFREGIAELPKQEFPFWNNPQRGHITSYCTNACMVGELEFISRSGILTIEGKTRSETREEGVVDIYAVSNVRFAKFHRPVQHHEIGYNRTTGSFTTDIGFVVTGALPEEVAQREGCDTYAALFARQFKNTFYPDTQRSEFEVLLGGFDVHNTIKTSSGYIIAATYHNSHGPGDAVTLHLDADPAPFAAQIFAIAGNPHLPEEMQSETYCRIARMHRTLCERAEIAPLEERVA
jgi:hypothetical protein